MKIKLLDVKNDPHEAETGTCEMCFGTMYVDEPVFVFQKEDESKIEIDGYYWSWGDYSEVEIGNIINFAAYISSKDYPNDIVLDDDWLWSEARSYRYGREVA